MALTITITPETIALGLQMLKRLEAAHGVHRTPTREQWHRLYKGIQLRLNAGYRLTDEDIDALLRAEHRPAKADMASLPGHQRIVQGLQRILKESPGDGALSAAPQTPKPPAAAPSVSSVSAAPVASTVADRPQADSTTGVAPCPADTGEPIFKKVVFVEEDEEPVGLVLPCAAGAAEPEQQVAPPTLPCAVPPAFLQVSPAVQSRPKLVFLNEDDEIL
jgi:hypothetical protein